ncbi:MAG: hypothetical protein MK237_01760, partial [Gemmatimonadetes bacterium]|nr:hypothetical protein [Gemmatimonadota bacterium]
MSARYPTSFLALLVTMGSAGLFSEAAGQTTTREAEQWVVPRTPDGRPDLQGNWTNKTITPFERAEGQDPVFSSDQVA